MNLKKATWQSEFILVAVFWLLALLLAPASLQAQVYETKYDDLFKQYTIRYLYGLIPDDDWRWFKAQCYQESRLKPDAISPADAVGLCQLVKGAAQDAGLSPSQRTDPEKNIKAGAFILRRNIRVWFPRDTRFQRLQLGWAGYNQGAGNTIKAQQLCNGAQLWEDIVPCIPQVTGRHAAETIHYVDVIPRWYTKIVEDESLRLDECWNHRNSTRFHFMAC